MYETMFSLLFSLGYKRTTEQIISGLRKQKLDDQEKKDIKTDSSRDDFISMAFSLLVVESFLNSVQ